MVIQIDIGNVYNQNGKIVQIEYAKKCVDKGNTVIALKNSKGVVMAVLKPICSKLDIPEEDEKIYKISENCYMSATGMATDIAVIVDLIKGISKQYFETFKEELSGEYLRERLNEYLYIFTKNLGLRVIGANFLIIKREASGGSNGPYSIFHADNTGKIIKFRGFVMGSMHRRAQTEIEKLDMENMSTDQMVDSIVKTFYKCYDPMNDKKFNLEIGLISEDSKGRFVRLSSEAVESYVSRYCNLTVDDIE